MKITTQSMEILESKSFLISGNGETVIALGDLDPVRFCFNFVENATKDTDIQWEAIDEKELRITLYNWNNPLGGTLAKPHAVGSYNGRQLFLLFMVNTTGKAEKIRHVTISFYLGGNV